MNKTFQLLNYNNKDIKQNSLYWTINNTEALGKC